MKAQVSKGHIFWINFFIRVFATKWSSTFQQAVTFSSPTCDRQNLLYSWIHMKQTPGGNILAHVIKDLIEVKQDNQATINLNQIVNYLKYKTTK